MQFQLALNNTFCPTPPPFIHQWLKHLQRIKLTKQWFLPLPHRFSIQTSQHQNWKANKCSNLMITELGLPVLESSNMSQNFMLPLPPLILNTDFIKLKSKMGYPWDSIWDCLGWEPAVITTTICSTTNGESLRFYISIHKVLE